MLGNYQNLDQTGEMSSNKLCKLGACSLIVLVAFVLLSVYAQDGLDQAFCYIFIGITAMVTFVTWTVAIMNNCKRRNALSRDNY